jgi:hypothetical protein
METHRVKTNLNNETGARLHLYSAELKNGVWLEGPPKTIDRKTVGKWESIIDKSGGNQGWVEYRMDVAQEGFKFTWNNPLAGPTVFGSSAPAGYSASYAGQSGRNATVNFTAVTIQDNDRITFRKLQKYKYQIIHSYTMETYIKPQEEIITNFILLGATGKITIRSGYAWDGPSGPTIDTKNFLRGSLVHDALYQLIREKLLTQEDKEVADKLLRDICLKDGMSRFRAWYVYIAVKIFGWRSAKLKPMGVKCAP